MARTPWIAALLTCVSIAWTDVAQAQYQTRFDDTVGWTLTSNHAVFKWAADDDPPGWYKSGPRSLNVQYAEGHYVHATAVSPAIDISGMRYPELSFWTFADVAEDTCIYDLRTVEIFQEGGPQVFSYCLSYRSPSAAQYEEYRVPLDPAWGTIRVGFDFDSVDGFANGGKGWFLDDLQVTDVDCPAPLYYCFVGDFFGSGVGPSALIDRNGSTSVSANDLQLAAKYTHPGQFAIFFMGTSDDPFVALGAGYRCVGGSMYRLGTLPTGTGDIVLDIDYGTLPASLITAGSTWYFQCWYFSPGSTGDSNLTDAMALQFCP